MHQFSMLETEKRFLFCIKSFHMSLCDIETNDKIVGQLQTTIDLEKSFDQVSKLF